MTLEEFSAEVIDIFIKNNWITWYKKSCEKFLLLGNELNDDEREMISFLLQNYTIISEMDYPSLGFQLVQLIENHQFSNNKVYIIPLDPEYKYGKPNSSHFMYELLKGNVYQGLPFFEKNQCSFISSKGIPKNGDLLIIDDFNGSGESIYGYIEELELGGVSRDRITILLLASMTEGFNFLVSKGLKVFCLKFFEKGISSIPDETKRFLYQETMRILEEKRNFKDRFGRHGCESLITLKNTPNNTFPVFWDKKNNKNAPFVRL